MKAIYRFHFDCGRMGDLKGIFVAEEEKIRNLIESGKEVYFGEVLGKHSEIFGPIEPQDISLITNDLQAIEVFEHFNLATGYNPFNYINEEDEAE
jgi:hypothetical protein